MQHLWRCVLAWLVLVSVGAQADTAEDVFAKFEPALLQVRVLENASSAKASIGTGFVLEQANLLVTNYHVVSEAVLFPDKYRLEYLAHDQSKGLLTVLAVDVINDLALLQTDYQPTARFAIQTAPPIQGATLYSLGNPHDLGMILVPGTYNGLQKHSFYPRIHFTGAVNSGMSGGPTVDATGQVVGINVASAGNQLGFLVPANALVALLQRHQQQAEPIAFKQQIETQLLSSQQKMFEQILQADWQLKPFGTGQVPDEIVPFIRCWGESNIDQRDEQVKKVAAFCSQAEEIYLSQRFSTGRIEMEFEWLQAPDLHSLQFYHRYQQHIERLQADNQASKDDVTPFECQQQVVQLNKGQRAKMIFCVRAYRQFPDLYDALYLAASLDHAHQGLVSHFTLAGVSKANAMAFSRKFTEAVTWQ